MNYPRVLLAALAATLVYFISGGIAFTLPVMRSEFSRYSAVYRSQDDMKTVWPVGIAGMVLSMVALATIYASLYRPGVGAVQGIRFGALVALFSVGAFVLHNHVNLRIGSRLTLFQAIAYVVEWLLVGSVIALVYRP